MNDNQEVKNENLVDEGQTETQYVDEFGNPIDPSLIDENGNYIGETVQYVDENGNPIDPSLIDENGNYIGPKEEEKTVEDLQNLSTSAKAMDDKELLTGMVTFDYNNVPITDIVNSIILDAINKGASDIHFDPFPEGIKIRIRIDGILHDYSIVPLYVKNNMITRIKIISSMNITESRLPQDGAIRTELANKTIDLRVACLPTSMGEKIVIRIMDYSMSAAGVEGLDFSPKNLEKVNKMLSLPNGIILVTGATGTGKSTTVYSMLQVLNKESSNIITVEDPIEMNIGGINQVQAQEEIGLNFAEVLRSILREDPDVIMIGEIRDDETARIAVRASITGHLVLSTIHTNNSLNTIERLTDMSVERYLLGSSLEGVISQKLARRLCPKCKKLRPTTEYEKEAFKKALGKDVNEIYIPQGCPECDSGYRGRIAIHEVLLINQAIRDAITKGVDKSVLRKLVYGGCDTDTMLQDGLQKVLLGETSFDEILKLIDLDDDLGSGTQLGLEEQMEDSQAVINQQPVMMNPSVMPPNGQPMYMPYPVPMQLDPDTLKQLLELAKDMPTNDNKEKNEKKSNKQEEVKPVITDNTPDEILDEEIETLDNTPKVNLDELTKNELSKEELETANFSTLDEEEFLDIDVDDDFKLDNKKEDKPIVTLTLNETNTVKPIPISIDEGFSNITIKPHNINRNLNKNKKVLDEDNMEVVTIKPKKASKTSDKKSGKKNKKGKKKLN
ncbi:MAG: GspE/PulE family protein [Bacilli bacterium]|nr:GspE/PulE family protein [Bacilli bacterium]